MTAASLAQARLFDVPMAGLYPISIDDANRLLVEWQHKLGAVHRPFTQLGYGLEVAGVLLAVAVSASTVSATCGGYQRTEVVELARLCSAPGVHWVNRAMLRLWREACAPLWPHWRPRAAVSYSHNALHAGSLYRLDGWRCVKTDAGSTGGGLWSRPREQGEVIYGKKSLWVWEYAEGSDR